MRPDFNEATGNLARPMSTSREASWKRQLRFGKYLVYTCEAAGDSSAARGQVQRRGLGKARHIQTRYLWIQERVGEGHVKIVSVPGKINDSDILTKAVSGAGIRKSLIRLGLGIRDKSLLQKETKKL